jgi:hypothetical protein
LADSPNATGWSVVLFQVHVNLKPPPAGIVNAGFFDTVAGSLHRQFGTS